MAFYFLNVFKPKGITSFDVVYKLRKILNIKKIGHSGTLDPMAEGVMQVAIGSASRLLEFLPSDKEYIAEIQFGYISTTLDKEGEIEEFNKPDFTKEDLIQTLETFKGDITQTPPKFSAIKISGQKLCDIARKNPKKEVEIPTRTVKIYDIELLDFEPYKAKIRVNCSKGTYIRTLADDIAIKLNTRAYLTSLIRTKAGNFKIEDSIRLDEITKETNKIEPLCALCMQKYELNDKEYQLTKNGVKITPRNAFKSDENIMLIYNDKLVSIGILVDNTIKIKKNFNNE